MSDSNSIRETFARFVLPTYARFDLVLERGEGSYIWDTDGKRYLDMGGGIAVCALGHAHPELAEALSAQARTLTHVSNLYYNGQQGRLAETLVELIGAGRVFFCNSGAEANEGLFKLARKFGHDRARYEIITTLGSFHGRTLAGIAATGQEKVKKGFEPAVAGFKQVPFNDLEAMRAAITPETAAILVESIQGESGITVASAEYLHGLRALCDEHEVLLLLDEVQAGHFRTGKFHGWQRIVASASSRCAGGMGFQPMGHRQDADATSPFRPMDTYEGMTIRQGAYLPHWTQEHATYAVTFRLADSLPADLLRAWQEERRDIVKRAEQQGRSLSAHEEERLAKLYSEKIEAYLDAGHGKCWLRDERIAAVVRDALFHFSGERYDLAVWCIMPNHVHAVVQPKGDHELSRIIQSWKSFSGSAANKLLGRTGAFWQAESFDHLIRDEADLGNQIAYVLRNPEKAHLGGWPWRGRGMGFQPMGHRQDADATDADATFIPDAISMAKSMGNGFPIGAFWVREKYADVLGPGTHASTFGGSPLACAVALKVLEIIRRDRLDENARELGDFLITRLRTLREKFPDVIREVRGFGLMIGIEFDPKFSAIEMVKRLHEQNLLTVPAATSVVRLLPPLNLKREEAEEALRAIEAVVAEVGR